jgi:hypothetical protein
MISEDEEHLLASSINLAPHAKGLVTSVSPGKKELPSSIHLSIFFETISSINISIHFKFHNFVNQLFDQHTPSLLYQCHVTLEKIFTTILNCFSFHNIRKVKWYGVFYIQNHCSPSHISLWIRAVIFFGENFNLILKRFFYTIVPLLA